jgi:GNAT superfamily N-acetyltransferase
MATYWVVNERGLVYVAEEDNMIVGFVIGELFNPWCSNELFATDYALYVIPEYRNKRVGIKLLDYFTSECSRLGAKKLITGMAINSFNIESMEKLLTRKGFNLVAKYYEKEL